MFALLLLLSLLAHCSFGLDADRVKNFIRERFPEFEELGGGSNGEAGRRQSRQQLARDRLLRKLAGADAASGGSGVDDPQMEFARQHILPKAMESRFQAGGGDSAPQRRVADAAPGSGPQGQRLEHDVHYANIDQFEHKPNLWFRKKNSPPGADVLPAFEAGFREASSRPERPGAVVQRTDAAPDDDRANRDHEVGVKEGVPDDDHGELGRPSFRPRQRKSRVAASSTGGAWSAGVAGSGGSGLGGLGSGGMNGASRGLLGTLFGSFGVLLERNFGTLPLFLGTLLALALGSRFMAPRGESSASLATNSSATVSATANKKKLPQKKHQQADQHRQRQQHQQHQHQQQHQQQQRSGKRKTAMIETPSQAAAAAAAAPGKGKAAATQRPAAKTKPHDQVAKKTPVPAAPQGGHGPSTDATSGALSPDPSAGDASPADQPSVGGAASDVDGTSHPNASPPDQGASVQRQPLVDDDGFQTVSGKKAAKRPSEP